MNGIFYLTLGAFLGLLLACNNSTLEAQSKKDALFYISDRNTGDGRLDTTTYALGNRKSKDDELIYGRIFYFKNQSHALSLYLRDNDGAVDDEAIYYVLDSIGVIYARSLVWGGYTALVSNNDSIMKIIEAAKNQILADPNLHCYQCKRYDLQNIPVVINSK